MSQVKCLSCNLEYPVGQANCQQCGARLSDAAQGLSPEAEEQLRQINESISALSDKLQEIRTPVRTTSFNGCGVMLLDYRPVAGGNYEASRWVTLFGFPLIPLAVWKIRPRSYRQDHRGEQQSFDLLGKRRITIDRVLRPYLFLALGALPFVLAYNFLDLRPLVYGVAHLLGSWSAVGLIILLIVLVLGWIGFIMTRFHNADKAYKQQQSETSS